jgi:hypothetical protein
VTTIRHVTVSIRQIDYFLDVVEWAVKALPALQAAGRGEADPTTARLLADDCPLIQEDQAA